MRKNLIKVLTAGLVCISLFSIPTFASTAAPTATTSSSTTLTVNKLTSAVTVPTDDTLTFTASGTTLSGYAKDVNGNPITNPNRGVIICTKKLPAHTVVPTGTGSINGAYYWTSVALDKNGYFKTYGIPGTTYYAYLGTAITDLTGDYKTDWYGTWYSDDGWINICTGPVYVSK